MKKKKKKKKKTKCGKCHGRFLRAGAFSRKRRGIIVFCIVHTFASTVVFTQFPLCRTLAAVFHCITVYKQPPSSLHRQHYRESDSVHALRLGSGSPYRTARFGPCYILHDLAQSGSL